MGEIDEEKDEEKVTIKEEGQMKSRGRERPTPLVLLHSGSFLKSADGAGRSEG